MKFGTLNLDNAVGAILAHGVKHGNAMFKKGRVLSYADVKALQAAGHETVIAARLEPEDVPEDIAAYKIATAACGTNAAAQQAFTGRSNLYSSAHGLVVVDVAKVNALNHLHESLTLATLANHAVVESKQMVATIKIIPFAVPRAVLERAIKIIGDEPLVKVAAFQNKKAGLIITRLPQTKPSLIAKSETAIRNRLTAINSELKECIVCDHSQDHVRTAISDLQHKGLSPIMVFGASAIVDRADVIPAALVEAAGTVLHLGMPVDPGNLMMLGRMGSTPIIGVPSCARSPKTNGFDWVLERIIADVAVTASDIMDMGAGGLLAEIDSRPAPREPKSKLPSAPRIAAVVLAAGKSSRMGTNKMLASFHDQPMIRTTVTKVLQSCVDETIVVTGNEPDKLQEALNGLNVRLIHNPHFAEGLATSLRQGLQAIADTADAVVICLGDMPLVEPTIIDRLIAAFNPTEHRTLVVPTYLGQFGNPVLWGREHFVKLMALEGDRGARSLIEQFRPDAVEIDAGSDAVLRDVDTPENLQSMQVKQS